MMLWAAGEEVSCSGLGQLVLGACVGGRVGQLVGSLHTTSWVLEQQLICWPLPVSQGLSLMGTW